MDSILNYLRKPHVHAALVVMAQLAAIFWPNYKAVLDQLALMGAYGATVSAIHVADQNEGVSGS